MINAGVAGQVDAVLLLRASVQRAQGAMLSKPGDTPAVNEVLAGLAAELAPAFPYLHAIAESGPLGPVAAVLAHLRNAFVNAAAGRADAAVSSVVTAGATAFRLADDAALDAETADPARWR